MAHALNYKEMLQKWEETLNKIKSVQGDTYWEVQSVATVEEVQAKEQELGVTFPNHLKEIFLSFSKCVEVDWSFPDDVMPPKEFEKLFSGEVGWNLDECEVKVGENGTAEHIIFHYTPDGDYFAVSARGDESILYWYEDESEEIVLAKSFHDYLEQITNFFLACTELYQFEMFLGRNGIDSSNDAAMKWKEYFDAFKVVQYAGDSDNIEGIISYVLHTGELKTQEIQLLYTFDKSIYITNQSESFVYFQRKS